MSTSPVPSEQDAAVSLEHVPLLLGKDSQSGCDCPWGSDVGISAATLIPG